MGCKGDLTEEDAELCKEWRSQRVRKPRVMYDAEVGYQVVRPVQSNATGSWGTSTARRQKAQGDTQGSMASAVHCSKEDQEDEGVDAVEMRPKRLPCMSVLPGANMSLVSGPVG